MIDQPVFVPGEVWNGLTTLPTLQYGCGFCELRVSSSLGIATSIPDPNRQYIYICSHCSCPTYFSGEERYPGPVPGSKVHNVPEDLYALYNEARNSTGSGAYTAAVLVCRKMLMNIAVQQGANQGETFAAYVEYLAQKGWIPPNGRGWVDYIRRQGNQANHEIALMSERDATSLVIFVEMLLRFIYEVPSLIPTEP